MTLKEVREQQGFMQQDIALYLGISRSEYQKLENCPDLLNISQVKVLCAVLRCDVEVLLKVKS